MRLRLTVSGACGELLPGQPVDGGDHGGGSFGGVAVSGLCGVEAIRQARSKSEIEDLRARSIKSGVCLVSKTRHCSRALLASVDDEVVVHKVVGGAADRQRERWVRLHLSNGPILRDKCGSSFVEFLPLGWAEDEEGG
jgi:hypothetical protein